MAKEFILRNDECVRYFGTFPLIVLHVYMYLNYEIYKHRNTYTATKITLYIKSTTYYPLRHNLIAVRRTGAPWPGWLWQWNEPGLYSTSH